MTHEISPGKRPNDITVFGCTGNAGRAVAYHVIKSATLDTASQSLRVGLAGRNQQKVQDVLKGILEELVLTNLEEAGLEERISIIVADASNEVSMLEMAKSSRVVVSCAGPFGRYGEATVKACISGGAHYLDITGEVKWVTRMITKHNEAASTNGVTLCPFSGYDCVPAELGMVLAASALKKTPGAEMKQINLTFKNKGGGFPKGTLETILDEFDGKSVILGKEDVRFYPAEYRRTAKGALGLGVLKPTWSDLLGVYTAPNIMTTVNVPVLSRAASALGYSSDLTIKDRSVVGKGSSTIWNGFGLFPALVFTFALIVGAIMMKVPFFRSWLRKKLQTYNFHGHAKGMVTVNAEAVSSNGKRATAELIVPGDAGIYATGLFAAAVANSLHQATIEGASPPLAGFHTPVVALNSCRSNLLVDNLRRLGAEVTVQDDLPSKADKGKSN